MAGKRPDQNTLGLSVYMEVAKYTAPLAERRAQKAIASGREDPDRILERSGKTAIDRPEGRLIWLHTADMAGALVLSNLIARLQTLLGQVSFLLTTAERIRDEVLAVRLPVGTIHQYAPYDSPQATDAFLRHWQPDMVLWSDDRLMPILLQTAFQQQIPLVYLNAGMPRKTAKRLRWLPGAAAAVLNRFTAILAVDDAAIGELKRLGVAADRIRKTGPLSEGTPPLPFEEPVRAQIAKMLHGRPVWLAAHVSPQEVDTVLEAHRIAQRGAHRLVTILSPLGGEQVAPLAEHLAQSGLSISRRSDPESLTPTTDVLFADVKGELGLWYRVASVSFIGNSVHAAGTGQNPNEAAALGSAIIHGPHVGNFADSYYTLQKVDAVIEVANAASLAEAVSELMAPDKAAAMAQAAWAANSSGAEATDAVLDVVQDCFELAEGTA